MMRAGAAVFVAGCLGHMAIFLAHILAPYIFGIVLDSKVC